MKKSILLFTFMGIIPLVNAQKTKVTTASMDLDQYRTSKDTTDLSAAKAAIDLAAGNEKTMDDPKMYLKRGEIYNEYSRYKINGLTSKYLAANPKDANGALENAYEKVDTSYVCVAANSLLKVLQLVPAKDEFAKEALDPANMQLCLILVENKATAEKTAKRPAVALALYEKAQLIYKAQDSLSTKSYTNNLLSSAETALQANNKPKAIIYFNMLIDKKAGKTRPYYELYELYNAQNDNAKATDILTKGRAAYPDDVNLIITQTNYYLHNHENDKAINSLKLAIDNLEKGPDKDKQKSLLSNLHFVLGNTYDRMANPKDSAGKELERPANYDEYYKDAETNYLQAIDLAPQPKVTLSANTDYDSKPDITSDEKAAYQLFGELKDLGALYHNRASRLINEANELPTSAQAKYDALAKEAKDYYLKGQPYLENANKIMPGDQGVTDALNQIYGHTGQDDKIKTISH
jgi:hypothetical protein